MEEQIISPVSGTVIQLEDVPDKMFSDKLLGDGIAVLPQEEEWVVPVNGIITVIYETKHAIGITTDQGTELLMHIGLDTYDLHGEPFELCVHVNDRVHAGDLLMKVNVQLIKEKGYNPIAPIISTNRKINLIKTDGAVHAGDVLFQIRE